MSRLEELIVELCPNGVEYKTLGEIGTFVRGNGLQKKDFTESGIGCIHYGQLYTFYGNFAYETKSFVTKELAKTLKKVEYGELIFAITSENIEDVCKCLAWLGENEIVVGGHTAIFSHNQNPKYITYCTQTENFFNQKRKIVSGTKVIEVSPAKLSSIKIPVPPLQIQKEVVRLLDLFTELTTELTKRKEQYQYYRNNIINFHNNSELKTFADVCCLSAGGDIPKDRFSKEKTNRFNIPIYSNGIGINALYGYTDIPKISSRCITISARGTIGYCKLRTQPFYPIVRLIVAEPKDSILAEYLRYVTETIKFDVPISGIPQLTVPMLKKYKIPVPPLEEQARIVAILDRFDALCNDLTSGLPAEIEARKKQYEYYRDKLLTFRKQRNDQFQHGG